MLPLDAGCVRRLAWLTRDDTNSRRYRLEPDNRTLRLAAMHADICLYAGILSANRIAAVGLTLQSIEAESDRGSCVRTD